MITIAERLQKLPPYLFVDLRQKMQAAQARGIDVISLGIGDPEIFRPLIQSSELCAARFKTLKTRTGIVTGAITLLTTSHRQCSTFTNTVTELRYPMIR